MKVTQYDGMKLAEARRTAVQAGFEVAVELVGIQSLNSEYRQGRITFRVQNDVVLSATIG